jgi:methionyl-tRNA formyltransferase
VYACREVPIGPTTTAAELRAELVELGTRLLVDVLAAPLPTPQPQVGNVAYAEKISPEELHLAWVEPALVLDRRVRVGGAWTTFRGRRLKVHRVTVVADAGEAGVLGEGGIVGTGDGSLQLLTVQPEGKAPMSWVDFANGARPRPGERLGE